MLHCHYKFQPIRALNCINKGFSCCGGSEELCCLERDVVKYSQQDLSKCLDFCQITPCHMSKDRTF